MHFKLIKINNKHLISLIVATLFIFAQHTFVSNALNLNRNNFDDRHSLEDINNLKENYLLNEKNVALLDLKEETNTFIIRMSDSNNIYNLKSFLVTNNYNVLEDLSNLGFLVIRGTVKQIKALDENFNIEIIKNEKWQGFPKVNDDQLFSFNKLNQGTEYQNPRSVINANLLTDLTGKNVKIAIIDTGLDISHPDFKDIKNRVTYQKSFVSEEYGYDNDEDSISDYNGHGTHVAGIAAGSGSKNSHYMGIAPEAKLIILKVGNTYGEITLSALLAAINTAINQGADVISISLGFSTSNPDHIISLAVDEAVTRNISVTISAGNSGPGDGTINSPASSRLGITVGAYDSKTNKIADFSSRGLSADGRIDPDIIAPGVGVIAPLSSPDDQDSIFEGSAKYYDPNLIIDSDYIGISGTSMASPVVAGAIALIKEKYPNLNPMSIRSALMSSATDLGNLENVQGAGLLNVLEAINYLDSNPQINDRWSYLPKKELLVNSVIPEIIFPTEQYSFRVFITSETSKDVSIVVKNSTLLSILDITEETKYPGNSSFGFYSELLISVSPNLYAKPGNYYGDLTLKVGNINKTISFGNLSVVQPKTRIYWSLYHTDISDSPTANFKILDKILRSESIYLNPIDKTINYQNLMNYDIALIVDPESAFLDTEMDAINSYLANGGNLIILGSFFPFINTDNLNLLTEQYGLTILSEGVNNIIDTGFNQVLLPKNATSLSLSDSNSILNSITELKWFDGSFLQINGNNDDIDILSNLTVNGISRPTNVVFKGNNSTPGKIFLSGQDLNFYDQYINKEGNDSSFFVNIVENFDFKQNELSILVNDTELSKDTTEIFTISYYQNNQQIINFVGTDFLNVTITDPEGNVTTDSASYNTTLNQFTFEKLFSKSEIYNISLEHINISRSILIKSYEFKPKIDIEIEDLNEVKSSDYPWFISQDSSIPVTTYGHTLTFKVKSESVPLSKPKLMVSNIPEFTYELTGTFPTIDTIFNKELILPIHSPDSWDFEFDILNNMTPGVYSVHVDYKSRDSESIIGNTSILFVLIDSSPIINLKDSTVRTNQPLENFLTDEDTGQTQILEVNPGENLALDISFTGNDLDHRLVLVLVPYYPFLYSGITVDTQFLNLTANNHFSGNFKVPEKTYLEFQDDSKLLLDGNRDLVLFVFLWDSNGNQDVFIFYVRLSENSLSSFSNLVVPFLVVILLPLIFLFGMMYRSSKRRSHQDIEFRVRQEQRLMASQRGRNQFQNANLQNYPQQPIEEPKMTPQFCGNCGSAVSFGETFCMECGKKIG